MVISIDGILVYSRTSEEHVYYLRTFLKVLRKKMLYAKLKKCEFWLVKVGIFGACSVKRRNFCRPSKYRSQTLVA